MWSLEFEDTVVLQVGDSPGGGWYPVWFADGRYVGMCWFGRTKFVPQVVYQPYFIPGSNVTEQHVTGRMALTELPFDQHLVNTQVTVYHESDTQKPWYSGVIIKAYVSG